MRTSPRRSSGAGYNQPNARISPRPTPLRLPLTSTNASRPTTSRRRNCCACELGWPRSISLCPWSGWAEIVAGRLVANSGKDLRSTRRGTSRWTATRTPGWRFPCCATSSSAAAAGRGWNWLPFRELSGAAGASLHFEQMCEKPQAMVDTDTELLKDLIDLFSGERSVNLFGSDPVARALPAPPYSRPDR